MFILNGGFSYDRMNVVFPVLFSNKFLKWSTSIDYLSSMYSYISLAMIPTSVSSTHLCVCMQHG